MQKVKREVKPTTEVKVTITAYEKKMCDLANLRNQRKQIEAQEKAISKELEETLPQVGHLDQHGRWMFVSSTGLKAFYTNPEVGPKTSTEKLKALKEKEPKLYNMLIKLGTITEEAGKPVFMIR